MPAATDKFKKVGNPGTATTLSAPGYTVGATSLTVASTTNHPTDTGVCVSMYEVTTVGTQTVMTPGSYNEYNGVVSGATSITSLSHVAGSGTDRNYAAGSGTVVTIMVSSGRENDLIDGLLTSFDQDGTLKDGVVATANISNAAATTAKQKTQTWSLGETHGIALNTNYQVVASQTLPAVTQAHKYLITSCFAVTNVGATTDLAYAFYVYEGANSIGYTYGDAPSGSYTPPFFGQTAVFTSSATGGQTITFGIKNTSATSGQSSSAGSFTIVDLGCA